MHANYLRKFPSLCTVRWIWHRALPKWNVWWYSSPTLHRFADDCIWVYLNSICLTKTSKKVTPLHINNFALVFWLVRTSELTPASSTFVFWFQVAFQLRLRRLLAINAPVLLAGTAGSGKSALLRILVWQDVNLETRFGMVGMSFWDLGCWTPSELMDSGRSWL